MAESAILNLIELKNLRAYPYLEQHIFFIVMIQLSGMLCLISGILKLIMADSRPFLI